MYGEHDDYHLTNGHVIPSLIHRCYLAKQNATDFVVWGSGKAEREFLYAPDVAAIVKKIHTENMDGLPPMMTVSPCSSTTIAEIVQLIVKHMGFTGRVVFDTSKIEGIMRKNTDNTLFRTYFPDFKLTDLNTGLAKTVEHFVKNYDSVRK
jgi:GDP-L-fucose synthase